MLIRDAREEEFAELGEIRVAAYLAGGFLTPGSQYGPRLRALGSDGLDPVLVAVEPRDGRDELLGTVMLQRWPHGGELLAGPEEAEIRALAVAPGAQHAGIGRALLAAVTERARKEGVRHLLLLTQTEMRAAHRLYAEAGFTRLPERDRYPEPGFALLAYGLMLGVAAEPGPAAVRVDARPGNLRER